MLNLFSLVFPAAQHYYLFWQIPSTAGSPLSAFCPQNVFWIRAFDKWRVWECHV